MQNSLMVHLVEQQAEDARQLAEQLFTQGKAFDLATVRERVGESGPANSVQHAFGLAFADAVAQRGVQALIQGALPHEVGERLGQGLFGLPLPALAYGLDVFHVTAGGYGDHQLSSFCVYDGDVKVLGQSVREQVALGMAAQSLTRMTDEARSVVVAVVAQFDKMSVPVPHTVFQTAIGSLQTTVRTSGITGELDSLSPDTLPKVPALPIGALLDTLILAHHDTAHTAVRALLETGTLGPRPVLSDERMAVSSTVETLGYALAEAMGEQGAQALADGMPLRTLGERLGLGLETLGTAGVGYGLDSLQASLAALHGAMAPTSGAATTLATLMVADAETGARLSTDSKVRLAQGMQSTMGTAYSGRTLSAVLSHHDKLGRLAVFRSAQHAFNDQYQHNVDMVALHQALNDSLQDSAAPTVEARSTAPARFAGTKL